MQTLNIQTRILQTRDHFLRWLVVYLSYVYMLIVHEVYRLRSDTSVSVSSRTAPRGRVPNCRGPMATRTSRCTPTPVSKNYVLFTGVLVFVCLRFSLSL
jgi:hypothetical protein